jgi:4-amino-4-deoxy-L-arabinose transferase-like glycosyltransferase
LAGLAGYASEKLGISPAWVCVASLVSAYTPAASLAWGYVDWLVILFGLACLLALDLWFSHGSRRLLWLAGIYAGLAFGAKYTAGVLVLGGIAAIFTSNPVFSQSERERGGFWIKLGQVFQFVVAFGLAALPWLLKNLLATGNPLYPFIFPAGAMDQLRLHLYQGGEPWGGWQDILLLPFRAALLGIEGSPGYSASIGPLLLGLGLAAWLGWSFLSAVQRKAVILASSFAVPGILIWIVAGRFSSYLLQSRLYFVFFPALAVLAGAGYAALSQVSLPGVRLGRIAGVLVAVVLLFNVWQIGMDALRIGAPQAALGLTAPDDYLAQNWGWYAPAMRAVRELPAGAKVLMLWEPRSLHCWPACEPDEVLDRWLRERYAESPGEPRSASQILHAWQQAGYTHLLFYRLGADFSRSQSLNYHPDDWQVLDKLLAQLHQIEDFGATYTLYSIPP